MSLRGIEAVMTVESATDGDVFLAYQEQVLCPSGSLATWSSSCCVPPKRTPPEAVQQAIAEALKAITGDNAAA
jgi:hypothetical protein